MFSHNSNNNRRSTSMSDLNSRYNEPYPHMFVHTERRQSYPDMSAIPEIVVVKVEDETHHTDSCSSSENRRFSNADYPLLTAYRYNENNGVTGISNGPSVNTCANDSFFQVSKSLRDDDSHVCHRHHDHSHNNPITSEVFNGSVDIDGFGNGNIYDAYNNIPYPYNFSQRHVKRNCAKCCFKCLECCGNTYGLCASGCHHEYCSNCCENTSNGCLSVSVCCLTGMMMFKSWLKTVFNGEE